MTGIGFESRTESYQQFVGGGAEPPQIEWAISRTGPREPDDFFRYKEVLAALEGNPIMISRWPLSPP